MSIDTMKAALEALEGGGASWHMIGPAIDALRAAIEQAERQEPVAWRYEFWADRGHPGLAFEPQRSADNTPLYAAPPQRQPLTDDELDALAEDEDGLPNSHLEFARAIERAHGIGGGE